jgi:hypothetical protein
MTSLLSRVAGSIWQVPEVVAKSFSCLGAVYASVSRQERLLHSSTRHLSPRFSSCLEGFGAGDEETAPRFLITGAGGQIGTELLHYLRCEALNRVNSIERVGIDCEFAYDICG